MRGRLIAAAADRALVGTLATKAAKTANTADTAQRRTLAASAVLMGPVAYARRITMPDGYGLLGEIVVETEIALVVLDPINSRRISTSRCASILAVMNGLRRLRALDPHLRPPSRERRPARRRRGGNLAAAPQDQA